ncbi:hypothetical protein [Mucilaginibacter sp. UR6-11]|uniref:hypothetical protein n=1 Tax=Mucilaginibacter sp. UR6-11 TaxID=1435644 RepID=UPI001E50E8A3|nr:hypothetical protein [Mucilaginibacter sp. UR6-11]MCC8426147.1 hypothetical protein [Mucilaginibacter sp. UR6-11]
MNDLLAARPNTGGHGFSRLKVMIVEVFKTNVDEIKIAEKLVKQLLGYFPDSLINFDLEDCDKILRVEAATIVPEQIIAILKSNGYSCKVLI